MHKTIFISDLHLSEKETATTALFLDFTKHLPKGIETLYVLGDLFEYWIGDDGLANPYYKEILNAFSSITAQNIKLFFMHGNRDFLLGETFCKACNGNLIEDPSLIDIYGKRILLMHGDTLCLEDENYLKFRKVVRDPEWQKDFLSKPITERVAIAQGLREQSENAKQGKSMEIMDVTPAAVEDALVAYDYPMFIHGHTHRPAMHMYNINGHECIRWVLPDWHNGHGGYLDVSPAGIQAHTL